MFALKLTSNSKSMLFWLIGVIEKVHNEINYTIQIHVLLLFQLLDGTAVEKSERIKATQVGVYKHLHVFFKPLHNFFLYTCSSFLGL